MRHGGISLRAMRFEALSQTVHGKAFLSLTVLRHGAWGAFPLEANWKYLEANWKKLEGIGRNWKQIGSIWKQIGSNWKQIGSKLEVIGSKFPGFTYTVM